MKLEKLDIPKSKINQLIRANINSVEDILKYIPTKYYDFSKITYIKDIKQEEYISIVGVVEELKVCKGNMYYAIVNDSTGKVFVNWFGLKYIYNQLKKGEKYIFCGKCKRFYNKKEMSLMYWSEDINKYKKIIPVYKKIKNMSDDYLKNLISKSLSLVINKEYLDTTILKKFNIINAALVFKYLHQPENMKQIELAKKRMLFDNLFTLSYKVNCMKQNINEKSIFLPKTCNSWKTLIDNLDFEMTIDQKNIIKDIFLKARKGKYINCLIQGDVGSGKTIVAIFLMCVFAENNFQTCLMAPTEILAKQHYEEITERLKNLPIDIVFLSSKLKTKEKRTAIKKINSGEASIVVGTHAVISKDVNFKNLGLVIIDEEHKFGVIQREKLILKNEIKPHCITLSATPIPRTLANVLYGKTMDVYTIRTKPKSRKNVITNIYEKEEDIYKFMYKQIQEGRQCYIVCPLIEDNDNKLEGIESIENVYQKTKKYFDAKNVNISIVNGKMKSEDIKVEIEKFKNNLAQILIATTIIEVGVNVPNASVIVIKNAERFGLAQLHQLRGRVGRSDIQSYCLLQTNKEIDRLNILCKSNNGFDIAQEDLKNRGVGEFLGVKQSGENKYINLMLLNQQYYNIINNEVKNIIENGNNHYLDKLMENIII